MKINNSTKRLAPIKYHTFTQLILLSFKNLDSSILQNLSDDKPISYDYKHEMIENIEKIFDEVRKRNIRSLKFEVSKCKYCYPNAPAYRFYCEESNYTVGRYVISENEDIYIFQRCENNPILPDEETGMPF